MSGSDREEMGDVVANPSPVSVAVVVVVALIGFGGAYTMTELSGEAIVGTGALLTVGVGVLSLYTQSSKQFTSITKSSIWTVIVSVTILVAYSAVWYIAISTGIGIESSTILSVGIVIFAEEIVRIVILR